MDFMTLTNVGIVGGIIAILQGLKVVDTKGKLAKGFYIVMATILGFLCGFVVTPYTEFSIKWLQDVAGNGITYAGAASLLYQTGKLSLSHSTEKFIHK